MLRNALKSNQELKLSF